MYRNITLICLLTVWLSACGGAGADDPSPEELARLQTMPTYVVDDNYEVFINTLIDQSEFITSTEFNDSNSAIEYTSEFTIQQTMSIEQVTWGGVANALDSRDLNSIQFEFKIFETNNGLPIDNSVISKIVAAQALKLDELALLENVYTFNVQQENLFTLQPGTYQLSIVAANPVEFSHYWLQQNSTLPDSGGASYSSEDGEWMVETLGRSVLIAGRCVGECKLNQIGSDSADVLIGDEQVNYLTGGKGNDLLVGGYGDDVYYFSLGDGKDIFAEFDSVHGLARPEPGPYNAEGTGIDVIVFGASIRPDQLDFKRIGFELHIYVFETNDEITIKDWFLDDSTKIEILRFPLIGDFDIRFQGFYEEASNLANWVTGDAQSNVLSGLGGHDIISGRQSDDFLYGNEGDDSLIGGIGADALDGGEGSDTAIYYDSAQAINISLDNTSESTGGTAQGDSFQSIENVVGSDFDDTINGDLYNNIINGNAGNDTLMGGAGADTLQGGDGDDIVYGGEGSDTITGSQGEDTLYGGISNDIISGGADNDILYGGVHEDTLQGDSGDDTLYGGADKDTLFGGEGNDTLEGGDDDDILFGEEGTDTLSGQEGNDFLSGGIGDDSLLSGGTGDDVISGGLGNDSLQGEAGADTLAGEDGNDSLAGGSSNDYLVGGAGNDYLEGGADADVYIFNGEFGQDIIYEAADRAIGDELVFSSYELTDLWFHESGNDLIITLIGTENRVTLLDYTNFAVSSDAAGNAITAIENALQNKTPISSMSFPIRRLDAAALKIIIDEMALHAVPVSLDDTPVISGL